MENKINGNAPNRVAQLRKEKNLTQKELGDLLYIEQRTISNIENGMYTIPNLIAIADVFKVSLDYILFRTDNRGSGKNLDELEVLIFQQLKEFTTAEKERLLEHLKLDNFLKIKSGK